MRLSSADTATRGDLPCLIVTTAFVTFLLLIAIGIAVGLFFNRYGRSWIGQKVAGATGAGDVTYSLVGIAGSFMGFHLARHSRAAAVGAALRLRHPRRRADAVAVARPLERAAFHDIRRPTAEPPTEAGVRAPDPAMALCNRRADPAGSGISRMLALPIRPTAGVPAARSKSSGPTHRIADSRLVSRYDKSAASGGTSGEDRRDADNQPDRAIPAAGGRRDLQVSCS